MLIGSFEHLLDAKGRVFIPAKWREDVGDSLIVTLGLLESQNERCLSGMSAAEWEKLSARFAALPMADVRGQAVRRRLYAMAVSCEIDKQGRILLPAQLREYAGLVKDATLLGVDNHIEIWEPQALTDYYAKCDQTFGEDLAHVADAGV